MSKIKEIVKKNINAPQLLKDVVEDIGIVELKELVAKSETKLDDIVVETLLPIFKEMAYKKIDEAWTNF